MMTFEEIDADRKFCGALHEALAEAATGLAEMVNTYAKRQGTGEAVVFRQLARALVQVQGAEDRVAKAAAALGELQPELPFKAKAEEEKAKG